jgi:hypothetical protein
MLDNMIVEMFSRILQNNLEEIYGYHFTVNRVDFFNIKKCSCTKLHSNYRYNGFI